MIIILKNDKNIKIGIILISYAIILYFALSNLGWIYGVLGNIGIIVAPFLYGFVIAYLLNSPFEFFRKKVFINLDKTKFKNLKNMLSLVMTYIMAFGVISILMVVIVPQLISSINQLINNFSEYINSLEILILETSYKFKINPDIINHFRETLLDSLNNFDEFVNVVFPHIFNFTKSFTSGLYNWIIGIIVSIYYLASKEKLLDQLNKLCYSVIPDKFLSKFLEISYLTNSKFGQFIVGKLLDSLVIGILCFLGMSILNIPYAVLISVIVGCTNVIPFFGPFIGAIPSAFILLIVNPIKAFWFIIFIFVLQQLDGNVIGPKIIGDSIGISGIWIMFSVIIGGGLFGVVGMIVGVPIFAVIYSLVSDFVNKRLENSKYDKTTQP